MTELGAGRAWNARHWGGLALVALALVWGVVELFRLRFAGGDVYPYGSSERADPLGSKALHDTLAELPGLRVERNLRPLERLELPLPAAVLLLGAEAWPLADDEPELLRVAETLAMRGARVVIAFRPESHAPLGLEPAAAPAGAAKKHDPKTAWGFRSRWREPEAALAAIRAPGAPGALPSSLPLHGVLGFIDVDAAWSSIYAAGADAVLLERRHGAGSIVVAADGFPFSNEALLLGRQSELLAWAIGGVSRVVFDETHLGVEEAGGVMVLARRYRLEAVLGALLVLAVLFVWRAAATLVPPAPPATRHLVEGGDAASGLARLLGRGIATPQVLGVAVERWAHDRGRGEGAAVEAARRAAAAHADPVAAYAAARAAIAALAPRLVSPRAALAEHAELPSSALPSATRRGDHAG